ncbi:phosphatidylserine decarboxylase precursor-related protein [Desulfocapsa sulfexigens DSM 10523]|uniref:Phosphatidylserine decarboxylase proenzyme n=1 Tax=Desulfocapsa sulfexigens (strain DSM 10523 / SB164P1) TaxID=1167006 RepID=M1P6P4_DESSD|nr:phosphatidylserine decarboxylase family protein [Desulfocapsa sulfexigens]AGF79128.1 phosphatidylserine decarboxylase precursor-related protein [Desulfocapsa sulfexigens DSM 10523]
MTHPRIPLAREGYPFIAFAAFVTLITAILGYEFLAWPALAVTTFVVAFFRDPERMTDAEYDKLISPADGKIILIEEQSDDIYLQDKVIKISIFMNVFNVHVNRIPIDGTVEKIIYKPGQFYSADSEKGALLNERCGVIISTSASGRIAFVQVAGLIARRIVNWLEVGDAVQRGKRFGLIRFGSRVDLYLPTTSTIHVKLGQKVRAGETAIASFS